ncbi:hypothetical protein [Pseudoalteromonas xiamenensis]|uniref:Uncharacterized protein n=1 Tax=Pseudoalteromonas xiamenensis TaxID=882626 RepID=A0A975HLR6_9GAMM|nr:hypothetical protein [Pseudoalteromonas xiamenensis]QTH70315.1 hypothetical protein J5O05_09780 [Pseudoalteromonas xiamenensis]
MNHIDNPFSVETPELMEAQDICDLFVPNEEYYSLEVGGHVFLHGHRGSGKSMMFRRLSPDCQSIIQGKKVSDLDFFGVYTSIKKTDIDILDYSAIENPRTQAIISEHVLVCFVVLKILHEIGERFDLSTTEVGDNFSNFVRNDLYELLTDNGIQDKNVSSLQDVHDGVCAFQKAIKLFDSFFKYHISFLKRTLFQMGSQQNYEGPLLAFYDTLLPFIEKLIKLDFMPNGPLFLLIDDVDNLNLSQTKVLNSWVSYRTTDTVSFKLATQLNYKTFTTVSGRRIEAPHDFSEIHYSNVYTGSKKDKYPEWVYQIAKKRLDNYFSRIHGLDYDFDPREFFPVDQKQENAIKKIAEKYKSGDIAGRGYRANDDAYRYARPDYIASLGGISKNTSTYKYAGFDQLVHLSSGVIRYFLEPASKMYNLQARHSEGKIFSAIKPTYQDSVIREESDKLLFNHIDDLLIEVEHDDSPNHKEKLDTITKLRNLIFSIGSLFYSAIKSNNAERRFFSFAISDPEKMSPELRAVLSLGVQEGYFYQSHVGTKEGMGRTKLFVLTRRLAPSFNLDPIGFSAYKFLTCHFLEQSMNKPKSLVNKLKTNGFDSIDDALEPKQQSLL